MIIIYLLLGTGVFFQLTGTLALHRFPDVYTRMHGATQCTTFGSLFIYLAVIAYSLLVYAGGNTAYLSLAAHTMLVALMILLTNPAGAHAIARAAHRSGIKPRNAIVDELRRSGK